MVVALNFAGLPDAASYAVPAPWVLAPWASVPGVTAIAGGRLDMGFSGTYGYLADTGNRDGVFVLDRASAANGFALALRAGDGLGSAVRVGQVTYTTSTNNAGKVGVWVGTTGTPTYTATLPNYDPNWSETVAILNGDDLWIHVRDKRFPTFYYDAGHFDVSGTSASTQHGFWTATSGGSNRGTLAGIALRTPAESPWPASTPPTSNERGGNYLLDPSALPAATYWEDSEWVSWPINNPGAQYTPTHYSFSPSSGRLYSNTPYAPGAAVRDHGAYDGDVRMDGVGLRHRQMILRGTNTQAGFRIGFGLAPVGGQYGLIVTGSTSGSHFVPVAMTGAWADGEYTLLARLRLNALSVWLTTPTTGTVAAFDLPVMNATYERLPTHGFAWTVNDTAGHLTRFEVKPFTAPPVTVTKAIPHRLTPRPRHVQGPARDWYAGDQTRLPLRLRPR